MSQELIITNTINVELIQQMGDDRSVVAAARVSTKGTESRHDWSHDAGAGIIRYLMSNRHGTPFEHNSFTFMVSAPIFVFREFHRHRIGFSYNEESGRYKQLSPIFYVPGSDRDVMQMPGGKPGHYEYGPADDKTMLRVVGELSAVYQAAYRAYETLLKNGVAMEVARMCLPVAIYSSMYVTCNARSLMSFLSLRQKRIKREPFVEEYDYGGSEGPPAVQWHGEAFFPSRPMKEINVVADQMEVIFKEYMPITHAAWAAAGYVAP